MFLAVALIDGHRQLVDVHDDAVRPLGRPGDVTDLVLDIASTGPQALRDLTRTQQQGDGRGLALAPAPALLAPVRPGKIVAIGLNYRDHVIESGVDEPTRPLVFAKFPSSVVGPDEPIVVDATQTERVDWEVELAVVIGRQMRNVAEADALDHVFGYTVANDVSARDVQFSDGQWVRGKSFDTFCPLGPVVATANQVPDPQNIRLRTLVNGEVVQDSSTAEMIFNVAEILAFCSRAFTLEPGDVVLTGTPWGCGEFMTPRRSLAPGDTVTVEAEGIGTLTNPVVSATTPAMASVPA